MTASDTHDPLKFSKSEPYFHLLAWAIVLFYPYIKYFERHGGYPMPFLHELNSLAFKMIISYLMYLWILPRQSVKKAIPLAILSLLATTFAFQHMDDLFHEPHGQYWNHYIANLLTLCSFSMVFFALHTFKRVHQKQLQINLLKQEKQEAELQALKSKVDPHFLFNTLTMIYANALKKDDKTPGLIMKLSDGFRYVLHEGKKEYVTLKQELQHLDDYVNLQQERLAEKVSVQFEASFEDEEQVIVPLLLTGFVENAFKYTSILKGDGHLIAIKVHQKGSIFQFKCVNPYKVDAMNDTAPEWKESGIGLMNARKRLELHYPGEHQLDISSADGLFSVTLAISL